VTALLAEHSSFSAPPANLGSGLLERLVEAPGWSVSFAGGSGEDAPAPDETEAPLTHRPGVLFSLGWEGNVVIDNQSRWRDWRGETRSLQKLEDNWNGFGVEAPNKTSVKNALRIIDLLENLVLEPIHVQASGDGGVVVAVHGELGVETSNSGEIVAVYLPRGRRAIFEELEPSLGSKAQQTLHGLIHDSWPSR